MVRFSETINSKCYTIQTRGNEVKILYNRHLPKLNFYLMLEEDWALNTLALLKTIDTKWVVNKEKIIWSRWKKKIGQT